jgi:hypothetical protein
VGSNGTDLLNLVGFEPGPSLAEADEMTIAARNLGQKNHFKSLLIVSVVRQC